MPKNFQFAIFNIQLNRNGKIFKHFLNIGNWKLVLPLGSEAGFTLVEILVALSILAVIGVIAVPNFRQFNNDQEITNATQDFIRVLQQAQNSAQSQIACDNSQPDFPSYGWEVVLSSANSYILRARCYSASTGSPNTPTMDVDFYSHTTANVVITTSLATIPGGCLTPTFRFYSNPTLSVPAIPGSPYLKLDFVCGGVIYRGASTVDITLTQNTRTASLHVDNNGRIYQ